MGLTAHLLSFAVQMRRPSLMSRSGTTGWSASRAATRRRPRATAPRAPRTCYIFWRHCVWKDGRKARQIAHQVAHPSKGAEHRLLAGGDAVEIAHWGKGSGFTGD